LPAHPHRLQTSEQPLTDIYDCAMLDLDGVVYVGSTAVAGVADRLAEARRRGMTLAFVTNNAARPPAEVAQRLRDLGVEADETDVVTSAQAAAALLVDRLRPGARVLVIGGEGLVLALRDRGLVPVDSADDDPAAVVQGFCPTVDWRRLAEGAFAVAQGLPWIASNLDQTIPTPRGTAPGNGALVDAVAAAVGRRPDEVAGKPFRPLFDETVGRTGSRRPLVVGDRLDTDIEGAANCGADSLLVMTGVTKPVDLCHAPQSQRPSYVAATMAGLLSAHYAPTRPGPHARSLGGWTVLVEGGALRVDARPNDPDDRDDLVRAAAEACWEWLDARPGARIDTRAVDAAWSGGGTVRPT
jgi:HAD superfamily hydrolase (TIGR01450 family)